MKRPVIISVAPLSLTGASLIHLQTLSVLTESCGCICHFVALQDPNYFRAHYPFITFHYQVIQAENSAVVNHSLPVLQIPERVLEISNNYCPNEYNIWLYGTYLFPYAYMLSMAKTLLLSNGIPCKLVIQPAGSDIWKFGRRLRHMAQFSLNQACCVFVYSHGFQKEIEALVTVNAPFMMIPPIIDTEKYVPANKDDKARLKLEMNIHSSTIVVTSVCNMRYIKGVENTIKIVLGYSEQFNADVLLQLVGPFSSEIHNYLITTGFENKSDDPTRYSLGNLIVRCWGPQVDVVRYLQVSDFFLNTSYHDSFNTSIAEAMSCQVPVITSSVVGILDYLAEDSCFVFNYSEIDYEDLIDGRRFEISQDVLGGIYEYINRLYHHSDDYAAVATKGRQFVKNQFSTEKFTDRLSLLCDAKLAIM